MDYTHPVVSPFGSTLYKRKALAPPPSSPPAKKSAAPPPKKAPGTSGASKVTPLPRVPATVAEGIAAMSKGTSPALKKSTIDKQLLFIEGPLYTEVERVAMEDLGLADANTPLNFWDCHVKPILCNEVNKVRAVKTGGTNPPHISHFVPLNRQILLNIDLVEIANDIKSAAHLGMIKRVVFACLAGLNKVIKEGGYRGRLYLKKNFYSNLSTYWTEVVAGEIAARKLAEAQAEEEAMLSKEDSEDTIQCAQEMALSFVEEPEEGEEINEE
jgi:hypothetical protein